jgi:hypothetical protein
MKRWSKPPAPEENLAVDAATILQIKVWLSGISPMVWRRVQVPSSFTLCELHGVIQVAMGWEGIHLYDFQLRAGRYVLLGGGCVVTGRDTGGAAIPKGCAVYL